MFVTVCVHCQCVSVTNLFLWWFCIFDDFIWQIIRGIYLWDHNCVCVCVCACVRVLSMCQCYQFIFVVVLHFWLFYLANYKRSFFCLKCIPLWEHECIHFCTCVFCFVSDFEDEFCPFSMWGLQRDTFFHTNIKSRYHYFVLFVGLESVDHCTKSHAIWTKITFFLNVICGSKRPRRPHKG